MSGFLRALGIVVLIAVPVHLATVWYAPRLIMAAVIERSAEIAGGFNKPMHTPPVDHTARRVVLPSPDLLYSSCTLDLAAGPVAVSATPPNGYFSLSLFDAATDNVFVINDTKAGGQPIHLLVAGPSTPAAAPAQGEILVQMPSDRGFLLLRALAATPELAASADVARRTLACGGGS
ncbi:DUF1254 domain-containing protein [Oleomonas cavernae]|uniref:DUF1254 domain-containing protein n=1 Tax=Oleomonas cavernae TaxID=2320859 RepID=A0A418WC47_9PROT|nr:DUF1254 domain-containing protein [Oleomonas cavernae]RJF87569.1 DUF1254 domain-containing protein [Oleomonas cavernae]